jgi:hypothetical protein
MTAADDDDQPDDASVTDLAGFAGPIDVSELEGWLPGPPLGPAPQRSAEVATGMTDEQILTHYRARDFDPYMTLGTARALYRLNLKFRHVRRAVAKAEQDAREEQRRRLRALVNAKATGWPPCPS